MTYFNVKTSQGIETIDELDRKDFNSRKEYIKERKRLQYEYNMAYFNTGMTVYTSQRKSKDW